MMENIKFLYYTFLAVLAGIATTIAEAMGGWDAPLQTLVAVISVDIITGVACAFFFQNSQKTESGAYKSEESLRGLIRKGCMFLIVCVSYRLDALAGTTVVRTATIMFFIANDGFSIIENLGLMGVPMPEIVTNAFELLREKGNPPK